MLAGSILVLAYRRDHARDRLLFDDSVVRLLAEHEEPELEQANERSVAFETCLQRLTGKQRQLIEARYATGGSVKEIATQRGQSAGAISVTLTRIRRALMDCIDKTLTKPGAP